MFRFLPALALAVLPMAAPADVTCAEMQAAMKVPAPPFGASEDPDGPLGCSRAALAMFKINQIARDSAEPVTELSAVFGTWLGDDVLSYVTGQTVPGQEVLVIEPGEDPQTLHVTQYWMKAAAPGLDGPLWSEDGRYLGLVAETDLEARGGGRFQAPGFGEEVVYGKRQLEFERSYDLYVKSQINHFELPLELALHGDVLILRSDLRNPLTRDPMRRVHSYTRIAPGSAELALGVVNAFELSQSRNFDCLTHQISDGTGPLFEIIAPDGLAELQTFVRDIISLSMKRTNLARELRGVEDDAARKLLRDEMLELVQEYQFLTRDGPNVGLMQRLVEQSGGLCPDFF